MPAIIETRALRKVYPAPAQRRQRPTPGQGVRARGAPSGSSPAHPSPPAGSRVSTEVVALDALDLRVSEGEFFGLLGPNGAGKTTTIGILTTRVRATSGEAFVAGQNVASQDVDVRRHIGVVPQRPNPDRGLDVLENLLFHGAYFGLATSEAERRAMRLLEQFEIADKAHAKVDELSGGQQQRLMITRALLHEPRVIFLDEPTVGLDPQARLALWEILRRLHRDGRTIVMTTHYMQEADELCDRLAIIDRGRLLSLDTPERLRAQAPGATLIDLFVEGDAGRAADLCRILPGVTRVDVEAGELRAYSERGGELIPALIRAAEEAGCRVQNINLAKPSLETLFIALTGRKLD
jgi:ABC-2 type transport system ATP-binding protein